jgi:hypothetical protein
MHTYKITGPVAVTKLLALLQSAYANSDTFQLQIRKFIPETKERNALIDELQDSYFKLTRIPATDTLKFSLATSQYEAVFDFLRFTLAGTGFNLEITDALNLVATTLDSHSRLAAMDEAPTSVDILGHEKASRDALYNKNRGVSDYHAEKANRLRHIRNAYNLS